MAEEILVGTSLLPSMIDGGAQLVARFARDDEAPLAAFWIEDEAVVGWKLILAFTGVSSGNPFLFYGRVLERAPAMPGLYWPALIKVEDATHPLITSVRYAIKAEYGKSHTGFAQINLHSTQFSPVKLYIYTV